MSISANQSINICHIPPVASKMEKIDAIGPGSGLGSQLGLDLKSGRKEQLCSSSIMMACENRKESEGAGWVDEATKTKYDILE
uniref:Uncharacterized protein n=1 Tax=Onchocerca volvulus TaxID=6282 RepID=A0A8R1TVI2_ONCVO